MEEEIKKPRITAWVEEKIVRRSKAVAALEGISLSEVVEKALDEYSKRKFEELES